MLNEIIKEKYLNLCEAIQKANYQYYVLDISPVTDQQYDTWFSELKKLEEQCPELITLSSPTQRVSEETREGFVKIKHETPMLSLDNTYNEKDLYNFATRVRKVLGNNCCYICEPKLDGASIEVTYKNGEFYKAITRGDGKAGEDVTENIKTIKSLPLCIEYTKDLTVRG